MTRWRAVLISFFVWAALAILIFGAWAFVKAVELIAGGFGFGNMGKAAIFFLMIAGLIVQILLYKHLRKP